MAHIDFFAEAYYKGSWVSLSLTPYQESSHGCWTYPKQINLEWEKTVYTQHMNNMNHLTSHTHLQSQRIGGYDRYLSTCLYIMYIYIFVNKNQMYIYI